MFDSNYSASDSILPIHQTSSSNNPFEEHLLNNFPSHLLDDELFLDAIMPYHPSPLPPPPLPPPLPEVNETDKKKVAGKGMRKKKQDGGGSSKRKSGKKDRHSKIVTARGPRDRRMRLSLQIARKFFDLQDMLGFDKASKTIEWLFNKSRGAIKDLSEKSCTAAAATATATSTIIISSYSEQSNGGCSDDGREKLLCGRMNSNGKNSSEGGIVCRMNEKRKEARARARERTKVKSLKNKECLEMVENPNYINNNTLDDDDDDDDDNKNNNNNNNAVIRADKVNQLEDQMASVGIIDSFLATSSSSMANFMEFPGNRFAESGSVNVGLMQELAVEYSGYTTSQVQGPDSAFMEKTYNQGF